MTHSKDAYDIDLNSLIPELNEIINSQPLSPNLQIPKEEYFDRISFSADYLKKLLGYREEPYFIVKVSEPSFDYWFALYLSTKKPHLIPLILDQYFKESNDPGLFISHVEHYVLEIIDKNVFYNVKDQLKEISSWIREKRNVYPQQVFIQNQIVNFNLNKINLLQIIQIINKAWDTSEDMSNFFYDGEGSIKEGLIKSPYGNLFFEGLKVHCEDSSISNLKTLLSKQQIDTRVILNTNFKKISLIRPIKHLIDKGCLSMNQKEASQWISNNFIKRTKEGFDSISSDSTQKTMARFHTEPKNAQIKYEHWFKSVKSN